MSGLVIPIKELSPLDLSAVRFAVEYGKRSRARLFFLFVDDPEAAPPDVESVGAERSMEDRDAIRKSIEALLAREEEQGELTMEDHNRRGDFIQEVRQFIRDHHADEIVHLVRVQLATRFTKAPKIERICAVVLPQESHRLLP